MRPFAEKDSDDVARFEFSLVRGDILFRLQRRVGLVPAEGLGVGRRAFFAVLVTWVPVVVWALLEGRALPGKTAEPVMQHFGIHVRCLVAIPLFIMTEATAQGVVTQFIRRLLDGGFVTAKELPRLRAVLADAVRLRDGWLPWVIVAGIVIGWSIVGPPTMAGTHELLWATSGGPGELRLGFGGWWFLYVVRPLFVALLLMWVWRLALWCIVVTRILRLDLAFVPTHPDQAMGLGYLERTPAAFQPFIFGVSSVLAATWAHDVLYHAVDVRSLVLPIAAFVVVMVGLMVAPLLVCAGPLRRVKRQALADYGALVAEHGRAVRERWILGQEIADSRLLEAPEIGPLADTLSLYQAVKNSRVVPISRTTMTLILLPLALPMIMLVAIQMPISELLQLLLKALV